MKFQIILCFALLFVAVNCDEKTTETESETCEPGKDFEMGCNTCKCGDSGKKSDSACTLKACPEETSTTPSPAVEEKCEPGTTFMEECNSCVCTDDGHKACTAMAC